MGIFPDGLYLFTSLYTVLYRTQLIEIISLFLGNFQFQCRHLFVLGLGHLFGCVFQCFSWHLQLTAYPAAGRDAH